MMAFDRLPLPEFGSQFCLLLTAALVHFVWQGFLLAVGFALVRRSLARQSANARYAAGLVTLILMAVCLPANLWLIEPAKTDQPILASGHVAPAADIRSPLDAGDFTRPARPSLNGSPTLAADPELASRAIDAQSSDGTDYWNRVAGTSHAILASISLYATIAYGLGLALMLTRVFVGLSIGHRLRRASTPISDATTLDFVRGQVARLALRATPTIAWCSRVSVPVVVGVLRPMILLPVSLATGLTARQLEYVLLHELAHIHRYDPLANLLERLIEALLFFHPAVWWLTRQVRIERENACDDAVLRAGCQGPAYAGALLRVAELCASIPGRSVSPAGSLAATGENPSQLGRRIHRLFNVDPPPHVRPAAPTVAMLVLFAASAVIALAAWRSPAIAQVKDDLPASPPTTIAGRVVDGDNEPLADADVSAVVLIRRPKADVRAGSTQALLLQQVKTDAHGDFHLQIRPTSQPDDLAIEIFAARSGSAIDWRTFDVGASEYNATLTLVPETPRHGQALDSSGKPAAGVTLWLANIRRTRGEGHDIQWPFWQPPQPWQSWPTAVQTDAEGKFVLHGVGRDTEIRVEAQDDRFAHQWWTFAAAHATPANPIKIALTPSRVVEGTVTLDGTKLPASGATVVLTSHDDEAFQGAVVCQTDADGHFRLTPYFGDKLEIRVFPPSGEAFEQLYRSIPWVDGTVTQTMRLSLVRSTKSKAEPRETDDAADSPSPEAAADSSEASPGVALEAALSRKPSTEKARKLNGRIFATATVEPKYFEAKHADGEPGYGSGVISIDPSDGSWSLIAKVDNPYGARAAGDKLAFLSVTKHAGAWVYDLRGGAIPAFISPKATGAIWAPDGKSLLVEVPAPTPGEYRGQEHWGEETEKWQVQLDGFQRAKRPLPSLHNLNDWSPDGNWILTDWDHHSPEGAHLYVMHPDGTAQRQLTKPGFNYSIHGRFSPDGRQIAYQHLEPDADNSIRVVDFDGTNDRELFRTQGSTEPEMACWSPDGHFLAVLLFDVADDGPSNPRIVILDRAGGYRGTVQLKNAGAVSINDIDWR